MNVGRHCFSDYTMPVSFGMRPNPWEPYPVYVQSGLKLAYSNYPAAAMVPQMTFGVLGKWLGVPGLGLFGYIFVLTIAVLTPAVWAARGARGLERVVVFVACGIAAIPAWMAIDRGNSVGLVVPIALVFLVALCRRRWGLVTVMVVLAALVKPQFAVLAVALFAARKWRCGGIAVAGAGICNVAASLLWPRDFPETITQSIHNTFGYSTFQALVIYFNVSFGKGLFSVPDGIKARDTGGTVPDGFLAGPRSLIGYAVLVLVVVSILALGRRIPPVMVGIALLPTAFLFPAVSLSCYLVFVLPVAALVARDPDGLPGTGIFDRPATVGGRRRAVCLRESGCGTQHRPDRAAQPAGPRAMAGQLPVGAGIVDRAVVLTTVGVTPLLWLITCAAIVISYARRPAPERSRRSDQGLAREDAPDPPMSASSTSELETEFSSQRPA